MDRRKDQHNVGTPAKPRGQQMGFAGTPDQNRQAMDDTPAVRGRRKKVNKSSGDESYQHIGGDSVTPRHNVPSTIAMKKGDRRGESGGETVFKGRLAKRRERN
jgi:hypothetical protein